MPHPTKYLLPCECGQAIVVEIGQAGQMVTCKCGRAQEVPTMRGIRALAPAVEENDKLAANERPAWSAVQGAMFGAGVLAMVVAGAFAVFYAWRASQIEVPPPPDEAAAFSKYLETAPIDELYQDYVRFRDEGLGQKQPPYHVLAAQAKKFYQQRAVICLVLAGIGVLLTGGAFVMRPKHRPPR